MIDPVNKLRRRLDASDSRSRKASSPQDSRSGGWMSAFARTTESVQPPQPIVPLRAAAAQLLLATAAGATLEHLANSSRPPLHNGRGVPASLAWAPALVGSLAAAAHLEHARHPSGRTATAVRILDAASLAAGGALFLADLLTRDADTPSRLAPLAFASAGVVGIMLEHEEAEIRREEGKLRRRAAVVERLVPRRRSRIDHVVVHV